LPFLAEKFFVPLSQLAVDTLFWFFVHLVGLTSSLAALAVNSIEGSQKNQNNFSSTRSIPSSSPCRYLAFSYPWIQQAVNKFGSDTTQRRLY
jgi:hypothetical protein